MDVARNNLPEIIHKYFSFYGNLRKHNRKQFFFYINYILPNFSWNSFQNWIDHIQIKGEQSVSVLE